jgi:uncharacterized membrane protein YfcA
MENVQLVLLPLIGLTGGFLSGFLGLGGGVVMLPLLTFLGGVPLKLATGTDLVHIFIAAGIGTLAHARAGMIDVKAGLIIGLAGAAGGWVGSFLSVPLSALVLQFIYLFVVASAIVLLFIPTHLDFADYRKGKFDKGTGIAIGFGVGLLAGLLGVGGGFIIIPLMTHVLKIPLRVTIGTSLLIIFISSLGTVWVKFGVGHINLSITGLVLLGSVIGALLGSHASRRVHVRILRSALLMILIVIFIAVGYKAVF